MSSFPSMKRLIAPLLLIVIMVIARAGVADADIRGGYCVAPEGSFECPYYERTVYDGFETRQYSTPIQPVVYYAAFEGWTDDNYTVYAMEMLSDLGLYFNGMNSAKEVINKTLPVNIWIDTQRTIRFVIEAYMFLPRAYNSSNIPAPGNPGTRLFQLSSDPLAVMPVYGNMTIGLYEDSLQVLKNRVDQAGLNYDVPYGGYMFYTHNGAPYNDLFLWLSPTKTQQQQLNRHDRTPVSKFGQRIPFTEARQ